MSKRYDAVMEKIEVTDAMRQRILANIGEMDLSVPPRSHVVGFSWIKRLMPFAACFVLLAGAFAARYWMPGETVEPQPSDLVIVDSNTASPPPSGSVMGGSPIVDVADAEALSQAVGFQVKELSALPFQVDSVTYTSFFGDLAQIRYTGQDRTVTLRQSLGTDDNSGDYNIYAETVAQTIGGLDVTMKGDGQTWSLAVWTDGTYAYSIGAEPGFTDQEMEAAIAQMKS